MITEPDVALTDYALAVECAAGLAGFLAGTVHGFFRNEKTRGYRTLWPATLIAIGVTGLAAWSIGATPQFSLKVASWIFAAASVEFAVYCFAALFLTRNFLLAVAHYLPAAIFFFVAFFLNYRHTQDTGMLIGMLGLALTLIATLVQQARLPLHPTRFDHNALYHLILAAGLFLIFWASRILTMAPGV